MLNLFETRQELLTTIPKGGRIAELGVFKGDFAADLLAICQPTELHLIDRWAGMIECGDQHGKNIEFAEGAKLYSSVSLKYWRHPIVRVHRATTSKLAEFGPGYFDFVYIDADHAQTAVAADLQLAAATCRGVIGGHDYTYRFPGVVAAVDEFCDREKWRIDALTQDGCPSFLLVRR